MITADDMRMDAFLKAACPRCDCAIEESRHEITFIAEVRINEYGTYRVIQRPASYVCRLDGTPMGNR